jgi:hypothetical protein
MNATGISVFYGAMEPDTCIAEVRAPVGSYVVLGRFEIIRPVRFLDLDLLTKITPDGSFFDPQFVLDLELTKVTTDGSWFDPQFVTDSNRAAFLRHLVDDISRPIMPRDEEFEYLPTQAVSEYLALCVKPRLDGIIFHSAQTAREGRNVVLFHHAAGVEPYALPEGTKVDINTGWASEDDYDHSIVVWEMVPAPKPAEEKSAAKGVVRFDALLRPPKREPGGKWDENEPTLRLDVQKIEVFRIDAVSYRKAERRVSRHRYPADEEPPF